MTLKPIAVVDVDETLVGFNTALHALAREKGIKLPPIDECDHWDALYQYAPKETVIPLFDEIHANQCSYLPFADAKPFLDFMKKRFYVVIASHRNPRYRFELLDWLNMNNLVYDEVFVTNNKEDLFKNQRVTHVIDDKAETIRAALRLGKTAIGLSRPWNRKTIDSMFLFDSLTDIMEHIKHEHATNTVAGIIEELLH
jgi:hypothetical protein